MNVAELKRFERFVDSQRINPVLKYDPHRVCFRSPFDPKDKAFDRKGLGSGQWQFHVAPHTIRLSAPGNGAGGSMQMMCEIAMWCSHVHRWQKTPPKRVLCIWFCPEYRQFDLIRQNLVPKTFGLLPTFKESGFGGPRFRWPDGSTCYLASYDRSWTHLQGIEADLIAFDEQPPLDLWMEMQQRRRGERNTRYICKATQTEGWSWMADLIYLPWLKFHSDRGLSEEQAMEAQLHPDFWVWPRGSMHDNPMVTDEQCREAERRVWPSPKERKVRLYGGFESINADCIFDLQGLEKIRARIYERKSQGIKSRRGCFTPC